MLKLKNISAMSGGALVLIASAEAIAVPVQWTSGTGANNHYYERIDQTGLTYDQAAAAAAGLTFNSLPGHLAIFDTANYSNEFSFVDTNVYAPGVTGSRMYWTGASWNGSGSNHDNWLWLDGSAIPTSITTGWAIDQAEGAGAEGAGFFTTTSHQLWDYIKTNSSSLESGYIVEYEVAPEPSMCALFAVAATGALFRRQRS